MKSIKPGRGPSMMGGIAGIVMIIFSLGWTILARGMGAPLLFSVFGICFVALAVIVTIYNFKNAKGKNRYSSYDIVDSREEPDPLNEKYGEAHHSEDEASSASNFCPYCGTRTESDHLYCKSCGKRIK